MEPTPAPGTPAPAPGTPPVTNPVVELIRAQRLNVGYALTVAAFLCLVGTVALALKTNRLSAGTTTATDKGKNKDPEDLMGAQGEEKIAAQPNKFDYVIGALGAAAALLVTGAGGAYLLIGLPKPTEAEQRRETRVLILAVGGLLGALLILAGTLFFLRWGDSLVQWLDKNEAKEAKYALYPMLLIVAGGGLMFLAIQPARAEERNNKTIRQLVYGSNFGLTVLILFVVLIFTNAVVAMRLPNKLDTTNTGFYTLNPQTKQFVEGLTQQVNAYAIFQEGNPIAEDTKRLLTSLQDANPGKFRVTFLSPALNRSELAKLRADHPKAAVSGEGVLLVLGDDGGSDLARHTFLRADEFAEEKEDAQTRRSVEVFNGEPKLLRELMFLAENKQRPKVYFTQSSGELSIGGRGAPRRRTAAGLKAYLEKNYYDVAELTFDPTKPAKVPDDATIVVVADPTAPLPAPGVEAIRKYMAEPRPNGAKGKLVVLAGEQAGADQKPLKLGLEPLLATFGVQLSDRFMFAAASSNASPNDPDVGTRSFVATVLPEMAQERNPVALVFARAGRFEWRECRELMAAPAQVSGARTGTLIATLPGRTTWSEPLATPNPYKVWSDLKDRVEKIGEGPGTAKDKEKLINDLVEPKKLTGAPRDLVMFVSESGAGRDASPVARVAVFGCGAFVTDEMSARMSRNIWHDLMGSTFDWLRDRPTVVGISEKPYTNFALKSGYDNTRLTYVPLGLGLLLVLGLGTGVWAIRRK
jgi:hypothetical protein